MHSRAPWEVLRLLNRAHPVGNPAVATPVSTLLSDSRQQLFEHVNIAAMSTLHGDQLGPADQEMLFQILQASIDGLEMASWWMRYTRLLMTGLDIKMAATASTLNLTISIAPELPDELPARVKNDLHQYMLGYINARLLRGMIDLGLVDSQLTSLNTLRQTLTLTLPSSDQRPSTIPSIKARCQCLQRLSNQPASNDDAGVQVWQWLQREPDAPGVDACAKALQISSRTLNRKLANLGTRYQSLQELHRSSLALQGIEQADLPLRLLAQQLGYDNPANFGRACRRWFGQSPRALRRALQSGPQYELHR